MFGNKSTPRFFDSSTPSMRKEMGKKRGKKIMSKFVPTNVVASRLPEQQLTAMTNAPANILIRFLFFYTA